MSSLQLILLVLYACQTPKEWGHYMISIIIQTSDLSQFNYNKIKQNLQYTWYLGNKLCIIWNQIISTENSFLAISDAELNHGGWF